ncbi:hypothetical protein L1N85_14980 [Paenibacillus alkaliterrae]|uniref:HipA domain-containing protein n=1 Tax=Paenibacillus alkaliterrae TaxID=320909 RepID=UPI001F226132|nr:hypothetical protein [Paenibacillus alkaliterrae]MCF2939723.1 hypothetical protein [Paenibacillus alkaliterrae]
MQRLNAFGEDGRRKPDISRIKILTGSKGELPKFIETGPTLTFFKAGAKQGDQYSKVEPVTEVICYEVGTLLGFDCVPYQLIWLDQEIFNSKGQVLACVSKSFKKDNYIYITAEEILGSIDTETNIYQELIQISPSVKKSINKMVVFDYLFNNTDRHLNNFEFFFSTDSQIEMAPLFDNERSLLNEISLEDDAEFEDRLLYDSAKPFEYTHKEAIKLVDNFKELGLDFTHEWPEIVSLFDKHAALLNRSRLQLMKAIFVRRYNNVRKLLLDAQER